MRPAFLFVLVMSGLAFPVGADEPAARSYENRLTLLENPPPLLADYPEFVEPVRELRRYEAPRLVNDEGGDLSVRAWRFSYNARGIIEMPNHLCAAQTALIMVHPWGIDDGQGWKSPEPAGAAFHCTPFKNALTLKHMKDVINPFLQAGREHVGLELVNTADELFHVRLQ